MPLSRPANPRVNPTGESIEPAQKPERVEQEPQAPRVSAILVGYNQAPALQRAVQALERSRDRDRLEILDAASSLESLNLPGYQLHPLRSKPIRHSIHVNGPWCITFEWKAPRALRVDLEQYH